MELCVQTKLVGVLALVLRISTCHKCHHQGIKLAEGRQQMVFHVVIASASDCFALLRVLQPTPVNHCNSRSVYSVRSYAL